MLSTGSMGSRRNRAQMWCRPQVWCLGKRSTNSALQHVPTLRPSKSTSLSLPTCKLVEQEQVSFQ
ncbi:hypothetical protein PanWU01x14_058310 [Parasponia andersonii]|uniref:Uncharacterized protein n=1 Tax=Parasponia andersonii TaxID=3476 RepID=A0A2P5DJ58_PARAD|nr:hypothetical protein PanWU01x14_058310 [Parasponia andersonii]